MPRLRYLIFIFLLSAASAAAMDFETTTWKGHDVIRATGPIAAGDTAGFEAALATIDAAPHGAKIVLLDSSGGSVAAAFRMSEMLDRHKVHMVIADGAKCASACASILFVAGDYRTMEPFGLFGQHSCSSNGEASAECNDALSMHAIGHGVSYGSIAAVISYVPPSEILWFNRSRLDCWGISHYPFTQRSGFEQWDPCAMTAISGREPRAQSAWRINFQSDGYRAFLRPVNDYDRELELGLYCDETHPGLLFLSMDIEGPRDIISVAIAGVTLDAEPVVLRKTRYEVVQIDVAFSRVIIEIPNGDVLPFLSTADHLTFTIDVHPPYETIKARTRLDGSREALIFAANHCMRG